MKKVFSGMLLMFLLTCSLVLVYNIQPVEAIGTIYIRADGSLDPPDAPISTVDNVTYTLTGNIAADADSIIVERDNIVLDGASYTVQGTNASDSRGMDLTGRSNVTIKNISITAYSYAIYLDSSSNTKISGNTVANSTYGIYLRFSSIDNVSGNNVGANVFGILLSYSTNNGMSGNNITNNYWGIYLWASDGNSISGNTFIDDGLAVDYSYHTSVENNTVNGRPLVYLEEVANHSVGDAGQVILVRCDSIRVENLNLTRASVGVQLCITDNSVISQNNVEANVYGIHLSYSTNNGMSGNNITNNYCGIHLYASDGNDMSRNDITNNSDGIQLESSPNNSVSGNNITANNEYGIYLYASDGNGMSGNNITANSEGIQLDYSSGNNMSGNNITANDEYGIKLFSSSINNISGNNITNNSDGIRLDYSSGNGMSENNMANNQYGIAISLSSSNNSISGNDMANNSEGIRLESSPKNSVSGNNITNNRCGIQLYYSSDNTIHHNSFMNNTSQVSSEQSTNVWDYGYPSGGNYWSDYNGTDADHDGIGDTPYIIDANNIDHYPLMTPYIIIVHDMAITGMRSKTVVGQGHPLYISVIVTNEGLLTETFNVTAYTVPSLLGYTNYTETQTITLIGGTFSTVTFTWNTTGVAKGDQTIAAYASPVPGETDTDDNARTFGQIRITIFGDLNGDFKVNIVDMAIAAMAMGSMPGRPNWNPNADVNDDWAVNIIDVARVAREFGKTDP